MWIGGLGLGCTGLVAVLVIFIVVVVVVIPNSNPLCGGSNLPSGETGVIQAKQVTAAPAANSIPKNYLALYQKAGEEWNIPWNILAGIGWVETHHGTLQAPGVSSGENYAGAGGPMQFLQGTFDEYKVDAPPGDGVISRYHPDDAIFTAARYLKSSALPGASTQELKSRTLTANQIRKAIFAYNHLDSYVNDVLAAANRYANGYAVAPENNESQGCVLGAAFQKGSSFGQRIAESAAYFARRDQGGPNPPQWIHRLIPYSWGGGDPRGDNRKGEIPDDGPSFGIPQNPGVDGTNIYGFDCSGLARWAVYSASGKKILLPRTADRMYESSMGVKVSRDQLAPGDLVFFNHLDHMGIYYGVFKGKRWMVEAPHSGAYVQFAVIDGRADYVGALRVTPPPGMSSPSPSSFRAMSFPGAEGGGDVM